MRNKRRAVVSMGCLVVLLFNCLSGFAQGNQQQPPKEPAKVGGVVFTTQVDGPIRIEREPGHPPFPPSFDFVVGPSGFGSTFSFASSEMSFDTKVVKGVPFSADAVNESTQTLSDGNRIVRRTTTSLNRDSEGRTRREQALGGVGPWATAGDAPQRVFINDPVSGFNYVLDPRAQIARKMSAPRLRSAVAPARSAVAAGAVQSGGGIKVSGGVLQGTALKKIQPEYPPIAKAAGAEGAVQVLVTVNETGQVTAAEVVSGHPLLRDAALEAARKWIFSPTELSGKPVKVEGTLSFNFSLERKSTVSEEAVLPRTAMAGVERMEYKKESLGKQTIEGVEAEGERTVNTIPAGTIGNERPIEIVFERWYSPELQTVVMTRHSDPRTGENVYRLVNVNRSEPAAHLFQVPSDYTLKEEPGEVRTMMRKLQEEK